VALVEMEALTSFHHYSFYRGSCCGSCQHGTALLLAAWVPSDVLEAPELTRNSRSEKIQAAPEEGHHFFLFAPGWHPALKAVIAAQLSKVRTAFNLLGPLESVASDCK